MLQEVEETSPTKRKLKINIPSSIIEEEIAKAYGRLRASAKIPGFRTGRIPLAILEKKFGKEVEGEVIGRIVPEFYSNAVREARISPVDLPSIEGDIRIVKKPGGAGLFQPLLFTATVEIKPDVKDLEYAGIPLNEKTFSVTGEEVESAIARLQENRAMLNISAEDIRQGSVAIIDSDASVEGREVNEMKLRNYPFIVGAGVLPEEFSNALLGRKKGDRVEVTINFGETYANKTLAGKDVLFKVSIAEVKEKTVPPPDDELAKGFGCSGMEELRKKVREKISGGKEARIRNEYKKELLDHLVSRHDFEIPDSLVKREVEYLIHEANENAMTKSGEQGPAVVPETGYETAARKNVKGMIILEAVGRKENVGISDEDLENAIKDIAEQNRLGPDDVRKLYIMRDGSLEGLKNRLYTDRVLDVILSKAAIEKTRAGTP